MAFSYLFQLVTETQATVLETRTLSVRVRLRVLVGGLYGWKVRELGERGIVLRSLREGIDTFQRDRASYLMILTGNVFQPTTFAM